MLNQYYPIQSPQELTKFLSSYLPLVVNQLEIFKVDLKKYEINGDHLGIQVLSKEEFDAAHDQISVYAETVSKGVIHERRNNTYKLNDFIAVNGIELQSIEIFEPKPDANLSKLKPGFEHIAMAAKDYDGLLKHFKDNNLPIDKEVEFNGARFFKTKFVNLVEVEFRDGYLWEDLSKNA